MKEKTINIILLLSTMRIQKIKKKWLIWNYRKKK